MGNFIEWKAAEQKRIFVPLLKKPTNCIQTIDNSSLNSFKCKVGGELEEV